MVTQNSSSDDFTRRVGGLVENAKRNTQWRQQFMEWDREMACMRAKGREEKAVENALVAIKEFGASPELAAEKMGAPLDKVLEALKAVVATA
jgi:hypothetical protein